ncbi:MAG: class I SAM-dependent RNA methyltransferase [Candidatus Izemoplasmataceae bacterium]
MKFVATCAFGIEAVLKREMEGLSLNIIASENGKIYFEGDQADLFKASIALRTAERIFIVLGSQVVKSYDELYDFIKTIDLKSYVSKKGKYLVLAKSVKSTLYSLRDIQSITKKAMIDNLTHAYKTNTFLEEEESYKFLIDIQKDTCECWLDTSGDGLHKRGYRTKQGEAPIKETLAAALVLLSFYQKERVLYDPFCGSGTIPIEAAMIGKNMAPNLNRGFAFLKFPWIDLEAFKTVRKDFLQAIDQEANLTIIASDVDQNILSVASENAFNAGVDDVIRFELTRFEYQAFDKPYGIIITNPPYGIRLDTLEEAEALYQKIAKRFTELKTYSLYMITSYPGIEGIIGKKADRTRVLFNGNVKARYYQYYGPKPS